MKYDDASWHYGGEFPEDLGKERAATHTGMFVAWALLSGLGGDIHVTEFPEDIASLTARDLTPGAFFLRICDGKFTDEDLNDEGNAFAAAYFDLANPSGQFLGDYGNAFAANDLPSLYHVADTWENFDKIRSVFDKRLEDWRRASI